MVEQNLAILDSNKMDFIVIDEFKVEEESKGEESPFDALRNSSDRVKKRNESGVSSGKQPESRNSSDLNPVLFSDPLKKSGSADELEQVDSP